MVLTMPLVLCTTLRLLGKLTKDSSSEGKLPKDMIPLVFKDPKRDTFPRLWNLGCNSMLLGN